MTVDTPKNKQLIRIFPFPNTSHKIGVDFRIFEGFKQYEKVPIPLEHEKDVELSDDIFCVSYLSYYYLHKKEQLDI